MDEYTKTKNGINELEDQIEKRQTWHQHLSLQIEKLEKRKKRAWLKAKQMKLQDLIDTLKQEKISTIIEIADLKELKSLEQLRLDDLMLSADPNLNMPDVKY